MLLLHRFKHLTQPICGRQTKHPVKRRGLPRNYWRRKAEFDGRRKIVAADCAYC